MQRLAGLCFSAIALGGSASPGFAQTAVPAPPTAPQPQPAPPAAETAAEGEIVVTGLRSSLRSAQAIKRNADGVVDAIVAEDIGKLPDVSASATLARIPGVQVNRSAGEAAQVQIRGLPDLSTLYNGREIFTAEGRFVAIQDFPAGGVAALEVIKTGTAEQIEPGIAGQVNVRSRRPFDFDGFEISGSLNGLHYQQSQDLDWNGSLLVTDRFETGLGEMGLLVNATMTNIDFLDATREQSLVIGTATPAQSAQPGFRYPDASALFYGRGDRKRPSVNVAFQWKPADRLELYVDGLFQGYRSQESDSYLFSPLFGPDLRLSDVTLDADGVRAQGLTATGAVRPDGFHSSLKAKTDTFQLGGGAIWKGERLRLSGDIAYTDSRFDIAQANIDYAFAASPVRDVQFDASGGDGGPTLSFRDFDATDARNLLFRALFDRRFRATGKDIQARTDLDWETGIDALPRLQFGVRYNDRDASRQNGQRTTNAEALGLSYADLPVDLARAETGFRFGGPRTFSTFIRPTASSIRENIGALRTLVGSPDGAPPFADAETFTAAEDAFAGYGQLRYTVTAGVPVEGTVGVRVVRTRTAVDGVTRDTAGGIETFTPVSATTRTTDVLPSATAKAELADGLLLRLAYSQTRTRPNFDQLNPSLIIDPPSDNVRTANGGNPGLTPLNSKNYDVSLEWYFAKAGAATIGLFRRDVRGFIADVTADVADPVYGALRVTRPANGGRGRLKGAEAALTAFFDTDVLPEWARHFGIQANYTYVDGKSELPEGLAATLPGRQRIPNVSRHSLNLVGIYERKEFAARLAYNYRSNWVVEYQNTPAGDATRPLMQDALGTLDLSTSVTPIESVTIGFDVLNLLGNPIKTYRSFDASGAIFPRQVKYLERVYSLGVRFRF